MPEPISPQPTTPTFLFIDPPPCRSSTPHPIPPHVGGGQCCSAGGPALFRPLGFSFNNHRNTLPAADAGGGEAVAALPALQLEGQGQQKTRSGGPQRAAQRNRSAVCIGLLA